MFEEAFGRFLEEQRSSASGQRLERLHKDLTGEKKMLGEVVWPVLRSFEGITLEYEIISLTGVKIYIDAFYEPLRWALESEGFVPHAQNITRDRFDFERMRVRTIAMYGYTYIPFSWDELDKKPEACRRAVYELLGRHSTEGSAPGLSVYEREVLRYAMRLNRPLRPADVRDCLRLGTTASRQVLRNLMEKKLIHPATGTTHRHHQYIMDKCNLRSYL